MTDYSELVKRLRVCERFDPDQKDAADALEAQAKEIASIKDNGASHYSDCPVNNAPALPVGKCDCLNKARADIEKLRGALENWDALIRHQYTGSREAMSDMTVCAQETARLLYGPGPWFRPTPR